MENEIKFNLDKTVLFYDVATFHVNHLLFCAVNKVKR